MYWGIFGAGAATVCGWLIIAAILFRAMSSCEHARYRLLRDCTFRPALWLRLIRYGLPSGMEFFLDILGSRISHQPLNSSQISRQNP